MPARIQQHKSEADLALRSHLCPCEGRTPKGEWVAPNRSTSSAALKYAL